MAVPDSVSPGPAEPSGRDWRKIGHMHPDLAIARHLLDAATRDVTYEDLMRPAAGKWSPAEVLEHLRLAFSNSAGGAARCVDEGQTRARPRSLGQRLAGFLVITLRVFPKARAPEQATPKGTPATTIFADTLAALDALDGALTRAAERFGERTPLMNHPYFGTLDVRAWRRFHLVHTQHHVKQIRDRLAAQG
jgi:hypothetical protein